MPTENNDQIRGPFGGRTINALGGDDHIYWGGTDGNAVLYAGDSNERYNPDPYSPGNPGGDRLMLTGNQGAKVWFGSTEEGTVTIGNSSLKFFGVERFYGTNGDDQINASNAILAPAHGGTPTHGMSIYAGGGQDRIFGSRFNDIIDGGAGNDTIWAGDGDDFIQSSTGDDYIHGGAGNENIRWGLGDYIPPGNDTISGGAGHDLINIWVVNSDERTGARVYFNTAESGYAISTMGGKQNTLRFFEMEQGWTHRANDTVDGSGAQIGSDRIGINFNTRWGDDILIGSSGNDTLEGGEGRDTITGGRGNDIISANGEAYNPRAQGDGEVDTLRFQPGHGSDTILGFDTGIDILDVGGRSYTATERADGTVLDFGNGDQILLSYVFDFI